MQRTIITTAAFVGVAVFAVPGVDGAKPKPKNITSGASAATIKFGGAVTLSGKLSGSNNTGRAVTIEQDPFPLDTFTNAGTATTNATGDWSFVHKFTANTRYRARSGNAESKTVDVMVRPAISLKASDRTPTADSRVRFSGRLCPSTMASRSRCSAASASSVTPSGSRSSRTSGAQPVRRTRSACASAGTAHTARASWATRTARPTTAARSG